MGLAWSGSRQVGTFRSASGDFSDTKIRNTRGEDSFFLKFVFIIEEFLKRVQTKIFGTKKKKEMRDTEQI